MARKIFDQRNCVPFGLVIERLIGVEHHANLDPIKESRGVFRQPIVPDCGVPVCHVDLNRTKLVKLVGERAGDGKRNVIRPHLDRRQVDSISKPLAISQHTITVLSVLIGGLLIREPDSDLDASATQATSAAVVNRLPKFAFKSLE
jgi:hypothetical protein